MKSVYKNKLSKKDLKLLGRKGVCQNCKATGTWQVDPCVLELSGECILVCLCDTCYRWRKDDI